MDLRKSKRKKTNKIILIVMFITILVLLGVGIYYSWYIGEHDTTVDEPENFFEETE